MHSNSTLDKIKRHSFFGFTDIIVLITPATKYVIPAVVKRRAGIQDIDDLERIPLVF